MPKTDTNVTKAAFLIDGHHVFLETISQIKAFCELMGDGSIAEATLFSSLLSSLDFPDDANSAIKMYEMALTAIDYADIALADLLYPGIVYEETAAELELYWFDAKLDPIDELKYSLKKEQQRVDEGKQEEGNIRYIRPWQKLLEANQFEFHQGDRPIVVPYALKNNFIDEMTRTTFPGITASPGLGWRDFHINKKFGIRTNEKAVDATLVIKACDLANDPNVVSVSLVTNDGDYEPAIKRLQQRGKKVFVYSLATYQSNVLRNAVGGGMYSTIYDEMNRRNSKKESVAAFGQPITDRLAKCPIFWTLHARMINDLVSLRSTGKTVRTCIRQDARMAVETELGRRID